MSITVAPSAIAELAAPPHWRTLDFISDLHLQPSEPATVTLTPQAWKALVRINRQVNAEDTELITRVQLGMQSPAYAPGPLGTSEVCLRSFAQKLRRLIPEARLPEAPVDWPRTN